MVEANVLLLVTFAFLILLLAIHLGLGFRSVALSKGPWKSRILRWGSLLLIPILILILDQQTRFRPFGVMQAQLSAQYLSLLVQAALQLAGVVIAFAGIVLFVRGMFTESKTSCFPTTLLAIFLGWSLTGTSHWAISLSAGLLALAFAFQHFYRAQCGGGSNSTDLPTTPAEAP